MEKIHFRLAGCSSDHLTTVEIHSEMVMQGTPARIIISHGGEQVLEIIGKVKPQPGADGKLYPAVELAKKE